MTHLLGLGETPPYLCVIFPFYCLFCYLLDNHIVPKRVHLSSYRTCGISPLVCLMWTVNTHRVLTGFTHMKNSLFDRIIYLCHFNILHVVVLLAIFFFCLIKALFLLLHNVLPPQCIHYEDQFIRNKTSKVTTKGQ